MSIRNLNREIQVINNCINVFTEGLSDCYYAYYLIFGNNVEKKFYTDSETHNFDMEVRNGHYKCIFFYKIHGVIYQISVRFEIKEKSIITKKTHDLWKKEILAARDLKQWDKPSYEYEYLYQFFNQNYINNGIHSISYNGIPIDLNINIKNKGVVFVFFNGASSRSENVKLPIFSGRGVSPADSNLISISDPTLYVNPELCLAWYSGSQFQNLQNVLLKIIKHIIKVSGFLKTVFVGGSGGGFASLYYSRNIEGSIAIVWNPQTNILRYVPKFVKEYAVNAFSSDLNDCTYEDLKLQVNTNLLNEYAKGSLNTIFYMQNKSDWHLEAHCFPFMNSLDNTVLDKESAICKITHKIYLYIGDWGEGHQPPSKEVISDLLNLIKNNEREEREVILIELSNYFNSK